ncbi:MAG: phosphoribosylformylglycinamidine cyclo-ligase [Vampirovibrionales bacterium]
MSQGSLASPKEESANSALGSKPDSTAAYRAAGVDLHAANAVVTLAKKAAAVTHLPGVAVGAVGGFSGGFQLPSGMRQPVILAACDGVGTKLALAAELKDYSTVGIDLVAMNANDLLASGGRPLVFLDYVATGRLDLSTLEQFLASVAQGCVQAQCQLIGGETAEMPGFYAEGHVDVAGFCVGVVEADQQLPRLASVRPGQVLIGLVSNGFHSNGYSLVRSIVTQHGLSLNQPVPNTHTPLGEALLAPTKLYVASVQAALKAHSEQIVAMAHITGGGFIDNLPRVLPEELSIHLQPKTWSMPPVIRWFQQLAGLDAATVFHTWNAGIGFVLVVEAHAAQAIMATLNQVDPTVSARVIGEVIPRSSTNPVVCWDEEGI